MRVHGLTFISADLVDTVHTVTQWLVDKFDLLAVGHWVLLVGALVAVVWGWTNAAASSRQGTIEVVDFAADDDKLAVKTFKADLQRALGSLGWLPASGVPSGSPTVDKLADVVGQSPIPQAKWLSAIMTALPTPATSTRFTIGGTIRASEDKQQFELLYQLTCIDPKPSVRLDVCEMQEPKALALTAAQKIYRQITELAPDIYPRWARWDRDDAFTAYHDGLGVDDSGADQTDDANSPTANLRRYTQELECFRRAAALDPTNMLCRLRAANCLERMASVPDNPEAEADKLKALQTYVSVGLRHPAIFEAGYRASILLSSFATACGKDEGIDARTGAALTGLLHRLGLEYVPGPRGLATDLEKAAAQESRRVRLLLTPFWTMINHGRFRHRFEPSGSERRQLRRTLGISRACLRVRALARQRDDDASEHWWRWRPRRFWLELRRPLWRAAVRWRYLAARSASAGWTAHYTAACYYALIPAARDPWRGRNVRRLALKQLALALECAPDDELPAIYVQDEDPDLQALRDRCPTAFEQTMRARTPDDIVVHYEREHGTTTWRLHFWGLAVTPSDPKWDTRRKPVHSAPDEQTYRIHLTDDCARLAFLLYSEDEQLLDAARRDEPGWELVPCDFGTNIWVRSNDHEVRRVPRDSARDVTSSPRRRPLSKRPDDYR